MSGEKNIRQYSSVKVMTSAAVCGAQIYEVTGGNATIVTGVGRTRCGRHSITGTITE